MLDGMCAVSSATDCPVFPSKKGHGNLTERLSLIPNPGLGSARALERTWASAMKMPRSAGSMKNYCLKKSARHTFFEKNLKAYTQTWAIQRKATKNAPVFIHCAESNTCGIQHRWKMGRMISKNSLADIQYYFLLSFTDPITRPRTLPAVWIY